MSDQKENKKQKDFQNPIDPDKIAENPHALEYGHHVGSAVIKPEDIGKQKGRALTAMEHQTDQQLNQLYEQMQVWQNKQKKLINGKKFLNEFIKLHFDLIQSLTIFIIYMKMKTSPKYYQL